MAYTTIDKPTDYFNTKIYTGNGVNSTDSQSITGVGFQPNWVWIKNRDTTNWHILSDSVRGGNKVLYTNRTDAERSDVDWYLQTFDSDGFTVGYSGDTNGNGNSLVSWNWLAGGTASSNSDGSITSSVSANTTAGFSIVSYTGSATNPSTVGHGLGTAPSMIIVKNRSTSGRDWVIWHKALGGASSTADLLLFTTDAKITSSGYWGSSAPSSTTFGVGNINNNNANGDNHIAYCFAEKKGYSKFGSYTGNGNSNGTFVYTGFKPAWVLIKNYGAGGDSWQLQDIKRSGYNGANNVLAPNTNGAEGSNGLDILSNGFKIRTTASGWNSGNVGYIYMAFAAEPLVANVGESIPATAR